MDVLRYAEIIDAFRVVPRLLLAGYGYLVWHVSAWFMALPDPNTQHTFFVSTVIGIAAPITAFYLSSGRKWDRD